MRVVPVWESHKGRLVQQLEPTGTLTRLGRCPVILLTEVLAVVDAFSSWLFGQLTDAARKWQGDRLSGLC